MIKRCFSLYFRELLLLSQTFFDGAVFIWKKAGCAYYGQIKTYCF